MDSSISTRSPKLYPKAGPFEMADATADLRKSMASTTALDHEEMRGELAGISPSAARLPAQGGQMSALYLVGSVGLHVIARTSRTLHSFCLRPLASTLDMANPTQCIHRLTFNCTFVRGQHHMS
jgi:hypothetical protein